MRFALLSAALALGVPAAQAADTDRVLLDPGLHATITTPPFYTRTGFDGDSGSWRGPNCIPRGRLDLAAPLSLTWGIGIYRATSAADASKQARTFEWKVISTSTAPVPHVVGGRTVGTIPATLVLTDSESETGYHEAGLGFAIARGRFVGAAAWSRGNAFACIVEGAGTPVDQWHRRIARESLTGIQVAGNLPPARVSARRSGQSVRGTAVDMHRHPLVAAAVALQRRSGSRWRVVSRARTSATGVYVLRLRGRGTFRVTVSAAGATARSASLRG